MVILFDRSSKVTLPRFKFKAWRHGRKSALQTLCLSALTVQRLIEPIGIADGFAAGQLNIAEAINGCLE
jgi:hypothetical protein